MAAGCAASDSVVRARGRRRNRKPAGVMNGMSKTNASPTSTTRRRRRWWWGRDPPLGLTARPYLDLGFYRRVRARVRALVDGWRCRGVALAIWSGRAGPTGPGAGQWGCRRGSSSSQSALACGPAPAADDGDVLGGDLG